MFFETAIVLHHSINSARKSNKLLEHDLSVLASILGKCRSISGVSDGRVALASSPLSARTTSLERGDNLGNAGQWNSKRMKYSRYAANQQQGPSLTQHAYERFQKFLKNIA